MKEQIDFFTDKLGMELVALYWMHGVKNTFHCFLRLNDESSVALMTNPSISEIPIAIGQTHPGNPGANSAPGTMQHLALKVSDKDALLAIRDRLREKGVPVLGPMDHGMCVSIYFAGLEDVSLEIAYSEEPINQKAWIDPEVVDLLGISNNELQSYMKPEDYLGHRGGAKQPDLDSTEGPHMSNYPEGAYEQVLSMPDEIVWSMVENTPPVEVENG
jgi:catechol 2,3-dioxygenase-like lactoylglutathione lyase family enzyme